MYPHKISKSTTNLVTTNKWTDWWAETTSVSGVLIYDEQPALCDTEIIYIA